IPITGDTVAVAVLAPAVVVSQVHLPFAVGTRRADALASVARKRLADHCSAAPGAAATFGRVGKVIQVQWIFPPSFPQSPAPPIWAGLRACVVPASARPARGSAR